jgi:hypothetical protein
MGSKKQRTIVVLVGFAILSGCAIPPPNTVPSEERNSIGRVAVAALTSRPTVELVGIPENKGAGALEGAGFAAFYCRSSYPSAEHRR